MSSSVNWGSYNFGCNTGGTDGSSTSVMLCFAIGLWGNRCPIRCTNFKPKHCHVSSVQRLMVQYSGRLTMSLL